MVIETVTEARDLVIGDRLLATALGGVWDEEVTGVRVCPDVVIVDLGLARVRLAPNEVCTVRRSA